ncbi:MAG: hypothetical protein ACRDQU_15680 [Pseudonocardiaceae bacterium]
MKAAPFAGNNRGVELGEAPEATDFTEASRAGQRLADPLPDLGWQDDRHGADCSG